MATDTSTREGRAGTTRPVALAGIVLGTALTVLAMWDGEVRFRIPDLPSIIGAALGAVIIWVLFMTVAAVLSELAVRHHRAAIRHSWRYGKRGGRATIRRAGAAYRGAASRSYPWRTQVLAGLQARWAARGTEPVISRRTTTEPDPEAAVSGSRDPETGPEVRVCAACGNPEGGGGGPLVTYREKEGPVIETFLIHRAHFEDPGTGYYGQPYDEDTSPSRRIKQAGIGCLDHGPACRWVTYQDNHTEHTPSTEGNTMTETPPQPAPAHSGHRVLTIGGTVPGEWKNLVAITADFEPEDDAELIAWMAAEVNGMSAYAEALTEVYETGVSAVGLDPVSLAALHDTADAAAEAASAMATARQKFAAHYAEVREFAASGGVLPHDGRWITGDGE